MSIEQGWTQQELPWTSGKASIGWLRHKGPGRPTRDLTGVQFGRLTAIRRLENDASGFVRWLCLCDCGAHTVVRSVDLRRGVTISCGCVGIAGGMRNFERGTATSPYRPKSPDAIRNRKTRKSPEYRKWRSAVLERDAQRCVICGISRQLCVHHLDDFSEHIAKRLVLENGITLCRSCHKRLHDLYGQTCTAADFFRWRDTAILPKE